MDSRSATPASSPDSLGGADERGPNFAFGASGLTLSGLAGGWEGDVAWELNDAGEVPGYDPGVVSEAIAAVRTDLDAFGAAEQAVLENHGYLLADAAARGRGLTRTGGIVPAAADPPHPAWMSGRKVRDGLAASSRRAPLGRLRSRRERRLARTPEATSEELTALLRRHRPIVVDGDDEPRNAHCFAIEERRGAFALPLTPESAWEGVRLSVVSDRGVAGATIDVALI